MDAKDSCRCCIIIIEREYSVCAGKGGSICNDGNCTRRFDRNFSFSIHILFDNCVRNSRLLGSLRTSEGTNPRFSSMLSSSLKTTLVLFVFKVFSWFIDVIDEKCCLNPLKVVCFPNFCLKTLKGSDVFPVLLETTAISFSPRGFLQQSWLKSLSLWR